MKKKYKIVDQLPQNAVRVSTYADKVGFSITYIYKMYRQGKIEIVQFQGFNFVLTNNTLTKRR